MKVSAIVPAAGLGLRLKSKVIKPLVAINSKPIIVHTLNRLSSCPSIDEIVVVFNASETSQAKKLIKENNIKKIKDVVAGGDTRTQSVKNGLKCVGDSDFVLIHDGARPFIDQDIVKEAIGAVKKYNAVVVGLPVSSTIKRIDLQSQTVDCTLRRNEMWQIQTPQVFKRDLIVEAYENAEDLDAPDDAFLVERLGHKVALVLGSNLNIKITTPEDLVLAEAINNINNCR